MKDLKELSDLFEIHGFLQGLKENSCSCCKEGINKAAISLSNFLRVNFHELTDDNKKTELDLFKEKLINFLKENIGESFNDDRIRSYNAVFSWVVNSY